MNSAIQILNTSSAKEAGTSNEGVSHHKMPRAHRTNTLQHLSLLPMANHPKDEHPSPESLEDQTAVCKWLRSDKFQAGIELLDAKRPFLARTKYFSHLDNE